MKIYVPDFDKGGGLVTVVAQDMKSKQILMVAYANKEALEKTIKTGYAHYFSRSRGKLWMKGETSGDVQRIKNVLIDCDGDALIYLVDQEGGGACHTGTYSCFFRAVIGATDLVQPHRLSEKDRLATEVLSIEG